MTNDKGVSIVDRRHPWVRMTLYSSVIMITLASITYMATRLSATYTNQTRLFELRHDLTELEHRHDSDVRDSDLRLSLLEETLFGDVQPKLTAEQLKRRSAPAENWQANRDRELRERIKRLEEQVLTLRQQAGR